MSEFRKFIQLVKVDVGQRLVYGIATAEQPDSSGEVCDYESTKPHYQEWSAKFEKATDGKSKGNLRSMHTNIAAGKITAITFNDTQKSIEICGKVVDDAEWNKVVEGVYTGFSQGGRYAKQWPDPDRSGLTRYTAVPSEVSLVDNPCLPTATFQVVKEGGAVEMRKFKSQENSMTKPCDTEGLIQGFLKLDDSTFHVKAEDAGENRVQCFQVTADKSVHMKKSLAEERARKLTEGAVTDPMDKALKELEDAVAKAEGDALDPMTLGKKDFSDERRKKLAEEHKALPDGSFPIEDEQDLKNAIQAYGRAADKEKAKAHIIERAKALSETKLLPEGWHEDGKGDKVEEGEAQKFAKGHLRKDLHDVARAACLIAELEWLVTAVEWEAEQEQDGSTLPDEGKHLVTQLCEWLKSMVEEETGEITEPHAVDLMAMAAKLPEDHAVALAKYALKAMKSDNPASMGLVNALGKAGARHSKTDAAHLSKLKEAHEGMADGMKKLGKALDGIEEAHNGLGKCHEEMGKCMGNAEGNDGIKSAHTEMGEHLGKLKKAHGKAEDAHEVIEEHHSDMHKCIKALGVGGPAEKATSSDDEAKLAAAAADLTKANVERDKANAERDELLKKFNGLTPTITELTKRIKALEAQPMPSKGKVFPVSKGHEAEDDSGSGPIEIKPAVLSGFSPEQSRALLNR
jgi:hypothetical protein